jgi:8-oxo-dGTP diphosphatase
MTSRILLKHWVRRLRVMRLAAWAYELYRLVRRPHTHGALVAIWWRGQLLLVQTSYRRGYGLPGGGLQRGETAAQAAVRELEEELELTVPSSWLQEPWTLTEHQVGGRNTVTIYSLPWPHAGEPTDQPPPLNPDQLEIAATAWMPREQALQQVLPTHLRRYLEEQR